MRGSPLIRPSASSKSLPSSGSGCHLSSGSKDQGKEAYIDGLELAAIDRNARFAEQFKAPAQHHELTADLADRLAVVLPEVGYCLEGRHQAAGHPNQLDVALALRSTRRLDCCRL